MTTYHIYPEGDINPHKVEDYSCECRPDVEYDAENECIYVIHNSFDGRELVEEAKRILNSKRKKL